MRLGDDFGEFVLPRTVFIELSQQIRPIQRISLRILSREVGVPSACSGGCS